MLIDWFTVAAQIINFLLLVWLLKHFLYKRILGAIDAREANIAGRLAEADVKEKEAIEQAELHRARLAQFDEHQDELLAEARREAAKQHGELLEQARNEVHALETRWKEDLERERTAFLEDLRRRAATEILSITRRTVADLASLDVQDCAVRVFLEKLRRLDRESCRRLAQGSVTVRAAFDLPALRQAQIRKVLDERLEAVVPLEFDRLASTGLGLELCGSGLRVGWNSESYLESLEEGLRNALDRHPERAAHAGAS